MRKKSYRPYLYFTFFLLLTLNLPLKWVQAVRSGIVTGVKTKMIPLASQEREQLALENIQLKSQNDKLKRYLFADSRIENRLKKIQGFDSLQAKHPQLKEFFERRNREIEELLSLELESLFARVVYRDPSTWSGTFWINIGKKHNQKCGVRTLSVGSPVLAGCYVIGVVDYVGKKQSRVRLLTDSSLALSVRAVRGNEQNRELLELIDLVKERLTFRGETLLSIQEAQELNQKFELLQSKLQKDVGENYLAKGELLGTSSPLWRSKSIVLKGEGFNYDFADREGAARELRSGAPFDKIRKEKGMHLLSVGDLLVTSGLDGVFPAGLPVATVTEVETLQEGAISYDIKARLCAGNLDEIQEVIILPSLKFQREDDS